MFDTLYAGDKLSIEVKHAPRVLCAACNKHILYIQNEEKPVRLVDLEGYAYRDITCPVCKKQYMAYTFRGWKLKTDRGYL